MFRKRQTKNSLKSVLDVKKIHPLVMDLNEQSQECISGGQLSFTSKAEVEILSAIALPNFINLANKTT